jgi:hypothetical protein
MEIKISVCEICKKEAKDEKQKRAENWIRLNGGSSLGLSVWLGKPRHKNGGFMHTIGFKTGEYDFCSIECLVKALKGKESI